jgi:hypothetical protein
MPFTSIGFAAKASALYTWGEPWKDVAPRQTYVGLEAEMTILYINGTAGIFRHVAGDDRGRDWLFSWGLGIGF